jgi:hypothetical protein
VTLQALPRPGSVPAWVWVAGAAVVTAGAVTAGVLVFGSRSSESSLGATTHGSVDTVFLR